MRAVKQSDTQIFHVPMLESKAFEITPTGRERLIRTRLIRSST